MRALLGGPAAYILALLLSKAAGFVMLPLVTRHLSVVDYARLEVLASVSDIAGIVCGLGFADAYYRFALGAAESERRPRAAMMLGAALLGAGLLLVTGQAGLGLAGGLGVEIPAALRLLAVSTALTAAIEVPLGHLRGAGRAWTYALVICGRTALQCGVGAALVLDGWGATGLFAGAAIADVTVSAALVALHIRAVGLRWPGALLPRALVYGGPLALGGIAGFALGSLDRWFLNAAVPPLELAHYGLAVKFGALVIVAMQPFGLWWYPRRMAVLAGPDGLAASARAVGLGLTLLWTGAAGVAAATPLAMRLLLPPDYLGAKAWVPWLAICFALHETASLVNVGGYLGRSGIRPMLINWGGAGVALVGYALTIPSLGVAGAILATLLAHSSRVALFLWTGRTVAPIAYPWRGAAPALIALPILILARPAETSLAGDLLWALLVGPPLWLPLARAALALAPGREARHAV